MEYQITKSNMVLEMDMAHEFQTPLAILKGNLELLENEEGVRNRRALRVMAATIDRLSRLVARTLERARDAAAHVSGASQAPGIEAVSVSVLFEEAHDECAAFAEARNISFSLEGTVPMFVRGSYDELKEVLLNLLSNALQHTQPGGSVRLRARASARDVAIEVMDTGSGIAPEDLPHIFDRFYRIGERRPGFLGDVDARGTGLGLAICREIVAAHDGSIEVVSVVGKGSRFIVRLPLSL